LGPAQWSQAEHLTLSFEPDEVRLEFTTYQLVQDFAGPWNFMEFTRPGQHTKNYGQSPLLMGKSTVCVGIFMESDEWDIHEIFMGS